MCAYNPTMKKFNVNWPAWKKIINERFVELVDNTDRYLICWGGRGSGKSDFAAKKLIYRCLHEKYFRCILIRNNYNSIKDSQYQTIQDIIINLGLKDLFEFKLSPLEITCKNGNKFLARGLDDVTKLKSIKDPSAAWWEEEIPEEHDFITVTLSIRTTQADYLQEIFTVNPEVEGDHQVHWFYKKFFDSKPEVNFRDVSQVEIKPGEFTELSYTSHHSTYKDNRFIPIQFVAMLEDMKRTNEILLYDLCIGQVGNRITGGNFYKLFSIANNTALVTYDPSLPLRLAFDFNVFPGVSCGVFQFKGKVLTMIDEVQLSSPRNTTRDVCREIIRKYSNHTGGMSIYGDPAGKHNDTRSEQGFNDFTIITSELSKYHPSLCVQNLAPAVVARGGFINSVFETKYQGAEVIIGDKCHKMIKDLLYGPEAADGTKDKTKSKDRVTGISYEKYGHFSDLLDYIVCTVFVNEFIHYKTGGSGFRMMTGKSTRKNTTY